MTNGIVPNNSKEKLQESLNQEEYALISSKDNPTINFKFKLIELFAKKNLIVAENINQ